MVIKFKKYFQKKKRFRTSEEYHEGKRVFISYLSGWLLIMAPEIWQTHMPGFAKNRYSSKLNSCTSTSLNHLNIIAVSSVTICTIRIILVIGHFCFRVSKIVSRVTHRPSSSKWRHITIRPEFAVPDVRLYFVHPIWSTRECGLDLLAINSF